MRNTFLIFFAFSSMLSMAQLDTASMSYDKKEAWKKIEGYRQRVLKGESMSVLAALYTEDPGSVSTGGRYDNIARGTFVPEFEKAALALRPGDISEVFETQYGFHFVQLIDRHGELMDVRHILIKTK